ncbi:MAG: bifunctional riboflavin kinase/FMN adenylyltransferase [Legionellales bacterium]|nr:bifunctional riboflavin kinase/FMN adenylyltransferase [Legionellales bacterium]
MELIRGLTNLREHHRGCVATIGNFDGVHRGHQDILRQLTTEARERQLPAVVIIFEPHANEFFRGSDASPRLTRLREKIPLLAACGVDYVLLLPFNQQLANVSAHDFVQDILVQGLAVQHLLVGDDFHFGHDRQGDVAYLTQQGQACGFSVAQVSTITSQDERISSTAIRMALSVGDLARAEQLLGRPYGMHGRVAHGDKRGRIIGFPTANIYLHRQVSPILGVYAVKVYGLDPEPVYGVANVGNRPTVDGSRTLLEIHLFEFDQTIYGHTLRVDFVHKLRDEKKYDSFDALKAQIFKDAQQARELFGLG